MLLHVGAKTCCASLQANLPHQAALDQSREAIINRCHRNIRHVRFGANKHFLGRGMIAFAEQHIVHVLPLRCETKATAGQSFIKRALNFLLPCRGHSRYKSLPAFPALSIFGIILSRKCIARGITAQPAFFQTRLSPRQFCCREKNSARRPFNDLQKVIPIWWNSLHKTLTWIPAASSELESWKRKWPITSYLHMGAYSRHALCIKKWPCLRLLNRCNYLRRCNMCRCESKRRMQRPGGRVNHRFHAD